MKQRFSSLDVKVIAHELSIALVNLRVSNIYDLSTKIFLVKFQKPERKEQIIIDSGFRCHLTEFSRATAAAPSPFVARLRKALKTRRVTSVAQVGTDRVIEFQFSDGLYRLYLEFFASGNIILTDKDLNILTLLRTVPQGQGEEEQRVGLKYNLEIRQNHGGIPELTKERLQGALQRAADKGEVDGTQISTKKNKKGSDTLRKALAVSITEYPPMLVDHCMKVTKFDSTLKPADVVGNEALLDHLMTSLQEAQRMINEITSSEIAKGYIIAKKKDNYGELLKEASRKGVIYEDFHPFRPKQFEDDQALIFLEYDGFNKTVDEFFSSIEGQKLSSRLEERELAAQRKILAARQDQAKRLGGLQDIQELNEQKASALQANVERVQETMDAVNGLIAQGKDWVEIAKLIELEQKRNNPVAAIIKLPLKLDQNTITIVIDEEDFGSDDESADETDTESDSETDTPEKKENVNSGDKRLVIDIDLGLSPWANAREYFDQRRTAAEKQQKTLQSSTKALKSQEVKIAHDLKRGLKQEKAILRPLRRQMWFEKFIWFISSDGYLVLAGKDAQQNEMLYKKYLKKGDVYVHADLQGAATVVIKNNPKTPDAPIPPSTLSQAGTLAVSCSSAWDSKAGMSAWWVQADQVSKSSPLGEYLPIGSFGVGGQKNFLPPAVLLLGFGLLFQISDESKAQHTKHRLGHEIQDEIHIPAAEEPDQDGQSGDEKGLDADADFKISSEAEESQAEATADHGEIGTQPPSSQALPVDQNQEDDLEASNQRLDTLEFNDPSGSPGIAKETNEKILDHEEEGSESESESIAPILTTGTQTPSHKGPGQFKRGKRTKAKKVALRYKDQDDSDRLAAQALLGATSAQTKIISAAAAKAAKEKEAEFQKERRRAQHQRTQQETAEHEKKRKALFESGVDAEDMFDAEEEVKQSAPLDALVGTPLKGDEILEVIAVCAPWSAMGKYKYKVKLQPGTVKKGKAVKEILSKWVAAADGDKGKGKVIDEKGVDPERMWPREVELIRGFRVEEVTNIVPVGKVRIVMSGGSAGTEKAKGGPTGKGGRGGKSGGKKR